MNIDLIPLLAFVLVTTFTPGPGNLTSAAMGMMYGYRRTFRFLSGIVAGYLIIMILCAFLSSKLLEILPAVETVLRLAGTYYILWLAVNTARATYKLSRDTTPPLFFKHGFLLQVLNPKAIIFGLTIYTTFLSGITGSPFTLAISTVLLTTLTFCSVSLWAFGGGQMQRYLHLEPIRRSINLILSGLLIYCAVTLSGIV